MDGWMKDGPMRCLDGLDGPRMVYEIPFKPLDPHLDK